MVWKPLGPSTRLGCLLHDFKVQWDNKFCGMSRVPGWLDAKLKDSVERKVDWQFVVTHFPPWWGEDRVLRNGFHVSSSKVKCELLGMLHNFVWFFLLQKEHAQVSEPNCNFMGAKSLEADWKHLAWQYGIDMFVTGHVHRQDVLEQWDWRNQFKPTELWPNQSHSIKGTALLVLKLNGERILP